MTEEEINAVCDLLKYIQKYPGAKHSSQGIARYWIYRQRLEERLEVVMRAIEYLKQKGFLEEIKKPDGNNFFKVNENLLKHIPQTIKMLLSSEEIEMKKTK